MKKLETKITEKIIKNLKKDKNIFVKKLFMDSPDLIIIKPGEIKFVEIKTEKGRLSEKQRFDLLKIQNVYGGNISEVWIGYPPKKYNIKEI